MTCRLPWIVLALALLAVTVRAQAGNGGNGDLEPSPMAIGSTISLAVTGGVGQAFAVFVCDQPGAVEIPGLGTVWLDLDSPGFALFGAGVIGAGGSTTWTFAIPSDPGLLSVVIYAQGIVADPGHAGGYALTRAIRIDFENQDAFTSLPSLSGPRALAGADLLHDGRVLVTGGGAGTLTAPTGASTTEIYEPYTRMWSVGPNMNVQRAFHSSVVLQNGNVLVAGGADANGIVTASCEVFDPLSNAWTFVAPMSTPRVGHAATLLADGRVLVTGGTPTVTVQPSSTTPIGDVLGPSLNTGEIWNPATNSWTPVANTMSSKRFAHAQVRLQDGRVACISGLNGAAVIPLLNVEAPTWTTSVSLYNPATNQFASGPAISLARAAHRATLMANGEAFVSGGFSPVQVFGVTTGVQTTNSAVKMNSAASSFSSAGTLPAGTLLHGQVLLKNGKCHVSGGSSISLSGTTLAFSATNQCAVRTAGSTSLSTTAPLPGPRGTHFAVRLWDGSVLIGGGADDLNNALATTVLYTPAP